MGRKKLQKKLSKNNNTTEVVKESSDNSLKNFVYILAAVLAVTGALFLTLYTFMDEPVPPAKPVTVQEKLQSDKILAQDTLSQNNDNYVVYYVNGEEGLDGLDRYYKALASGKAQLPVYVVDMQEAINASHLVDDSEEVEKYGERRAPAVIKYNKDPKNVEDIEVYNFPTVIHVSEKAIAGYYEKDEIFKALGINDQTQSGSQ